jgi:hypothetical protein
LTVKAFAPVPSAVRVRLPSTGTFVNCWLVSRSQNFVNFNQTLGTLKLN